MAKAYRAPLLYKTKITFDATQLPAAWYDALVKKLPKTLTLKKGKNGQFIIEGRHARDYDIGRATTLLTRMGVDSYAIQTPKALYGGVGRRILNWPLSKTDLPRSVVETLQKLGFKTARELAYKTTKKRANEIRQNLTRYAATRLRKWFMLRELGRIDWLLPQKGQAMK